MENVILTRNVFIASAFREILHECRCKNTCVVDIDSYHSLREVLRVIKDADLNQNQRMFIIKGISVFSQTLTSIAAVNILDSLSHIKHVFLKGRVPNYAFVVKYIREHSKLSMMTHKEKELAYALMKYNDVSSMSHAMNSNHKTMYSRMRVMAMKLNLRDIAQVRKFILFEMAAGNVTR